jgi:hypothetical protein
MADASRTRCCPIKICPTWVECAPLPEPDICDLSTEWISENGNPVAVTAWITNNDTVAKNYFWSVMPATVSGCTGTLPPSAFIPASGTVIVGPSSSLGVSFSVNGSSLLPGQCAGFEICFLDIDNPALPPICCISTVKRSGGDPCIVWNPTGRAVPLATGYLPIEIKNPTGLTMDLTLVLFDSEGDLTFSRGAGWPAEALPAFELSLAPGASEVIELEGIPPAGIPRIKPVFSNIGIIWCRPLVDPALVGSSYFYQPEAPAAEPPPLSLDIIPPGAWNTPGPAAHLSLPTEVGGEYMLFSSSVLALPSWAPAWPVPTGAAQASDGTIAGSGEPVAIDALIPPPGGPRLYFRMWRSLFDSPGVP